MTVRFSFPKRSTSRSAPASRTSLSMGARTGLPVLRSSSESEASAGRGRRRRWCSDLEVGDQSGVANQPDSDQGDADVADDGTLSVGKILSRTRKKISTPKHPVWLYG